MEVHLAHFVDDVFTFESNKAKTWLVGWLDVCGWSAKCGGEGGDGEGSESESEKGKKEKEKEKCANALAILSENMRIEFGGVCREKKKR